MSTDHQANKGRRQAMRARVRRGVRLWNALLDAGASRSAATPGIWNYPYPQR